jgi:spore coat protein U-like protein
MLDLLAQRTGYRSRWQSYVGALFIALLPLNARAIASCSVTANAVVFGGYTFNNPSTTQSVGNVKVSCSLLGLISLLVSYNIRLSPGISATFAPRNMASGANTLQYNLYVDSGHSSVWGDGTAGTAFVSDGYLLGLLTTVNDYAVYGAIPAGQNVPIGTYSDTITVTVNY